MLLDFHTDAAHATYDTDVCVVGSGAAGLTLASHLTGLRVLVIEAGGRKARSDGDFLAGEAADFAFTGFESGRARALGGSTRLWYGQCLRLDPIDFERRDWVPHSGWPMTAAELDPFYDRAEAFAGIGQAVYDSRNWTNFGIPDPDFGADLMAKFTVYMPQPDFSKLLGQRLGREPTLDILLNAAVTSIEMDSNGQRINALTLAGAGGRCGRVTAKAFVLCGGGIGNPRLLLASDSVMADGIGNARGLVGRFFQDHPSATAGTLATARASTVQHQFRKLRRARRTSWPKLALTEAAQRRGRTLNANALLLYDYDDESALTRAKAVLDAVQARKPAEVITGAWRVTRHVPELAARAAHTVATGKAPAFKPSRVMLKTHVEQRPDPENRITLGATRDRHGMRLPRLAWRIHPEELRTMRSITEAAGRAFTALGWGTMTPAAWLDDGPDAARPHIEDTYHHHGTTRMAASEADGVTDPQCRVFGTDNLYIAGSSLFPTSGYANPTLTIMALAIRLGDTLRQRLGAA